MKHHRSCGPELAMSDTMWCGLSSLGLASSWPDDLEFVSVSLYIHCMFHIQEEKYNSVEVVFAVTFSIFVQVMTGFLLSPIYVYHFLFMYVRSYAVPCLTPLYCCLLYLFSGLNNCLIFLEKMLHSEDSQTDECCLLLALIQYCLSHCYNSS